MIEMDEAGLKFSFPEVAERVRKMAEEEIGRRIPRWMAEDHGVVLQRWRSTGSVKRPEVAEWCDEAERRLAQATEKDFRHAALSAVEIPPCEMRVGFQRTLRIPDDGRDYPLPPGLGRFPLRHVDDFAASVPAAWLERGGVMMPMHQSEALWLEFGARYPFALKIATGKVNAISGENWSAGLHRQPQDYVVLPDQPWLDGYCVARGAIRQFVAMPLGDGYGAEEQITGRAEFGGIQLQAHPLSSKIFFEESIRRELPDSLKDLLRHLVGRPIPFVTYHCGGTGTFPEAMPCCESAPDMSLGAGGRMRQEIYEDRRGAGAWDTHVSSRCFVHLCNSRAWRKITGTKPPSPPFSAAEYTRHGLPWFDYYDDSKVAVGGAEPLKDLKSIAEMGEGKGEIPLPENESVDPTLIVQYGVRRRPEQVREWVEKE
ncbi:MAG TPA: hypothetical protein PLU30_06945 [Verrucomicrobiae bacterium]|nr:hypothetical protein [Verrucomicrobiae bacterium]